MKTHPLFHETPSAEEHEVLCFRCIFYRQFSKAKITPAFPLQAYLLFADLLALTFKIKHRQIRVGLHVSCKDILDCLQESASSLMGSLAPVVFQELGLRTTKDLDLLLQQAIKTRIFGHQKDDDDFSRYNVDLIELLRKPPELKGSQ